MVYKSATQSVIFSTGCLWICRIFLDDSRHQDNEKCLFTQILDEAYSLIYEEFNFPLKGLIR